MWTYKGVELTTKHFMLFWEKVKAFPNDIESCWYWDFENFNVSQGGYGRVNFQNRVFHSNQLAYLFHYGNIEEGRIILHSDCCIENAINKFGDGRMARLCCNPFHLRQGTYKENNNDTKRQGRMKGWFEKGRTGDSGENHPQHKLSSWDVEMIKQDTRPQYQLSRIYKVSQSTISRIKSGLRRKEG